MAEKRPQRYVNLRLETGKGVAFSVNLGRENYMTISQCAAYLYEINLGDKGKNGSLRHLAFIIGGEVYKKTCGAPKETVVELLSEYYCAPSRFEQIWDSLTNAEKKIVSLHVWGNGQEPTECADDVAKEFGIVKNSDRFLYCYTTNGLDRFKSNFAMKNSKLWLLFPSSRHNCILHSDLVAAVGEMKRVYSTLSNKVDFESRQNRLSDFLNIIRFCNSNKVTVLKSGFISKSSALKIRDFCDYDEFAAYIDFEPEEMRTTEGLLVTFPLIVFCYLSGLLTTANGVCIPSNKAVSLLELPHVELVKKVFNSYLSSRSFDEISLIKGIKPKRGHNPTRARQNIIEELKYCPVGQAVATRDFEQYLRIGSKDFARKEERHVVEGGNSYYDYGASWDEYESFLIRIILTFFGALGIIDIAWGDETINYVSDRLQPIAFKINTLGAYILGLSDTYHAPIVPKEKISGGFTVLPDYTIIVPESDSRIKHELYFEKNFTKISSTDQATIYKLDFETIVRTLDCGKTISALRKYLSASDKPLPDNVTRALEDWDKQSGRIRIRQVTIIECDDNALLEEVLHYKGMGAYAKDKIAAAAVVEGESTAKIKKLIEKNKRFCKNVI